MKTGIHVTWFGPHRRFWVMNLAVSSPAPKASREMVAAVAEILDHGQVRVRVADTFLVPSYTLLSIIPISRLRRPVLHSFRILPGNSANSPFGNENAFHPSITFYISCMIKIVSPTEMSKIIKPAKSLNALEIGLLTCEAMRALPDSKEML